MPVSAAFTPVAGGDATLARVGCSISIARTAGTDNGTGKNAAKATKETTGGVFLCGTLVAPREFAGVVLPAGDCELLLSVTEAEAMASLEGDVESSEVPMAAAKLPAFRADELERLKKPESELVAGALLLPDSMAVVTV